MNYLLFPLLTISFFFKIENSEAQTNHIKKSENLTILQISSLKEWGILIPKDKKCINIYIKSKVGWDLEKSFVVYNEKDKTDGLFDESYVEYKVLFYKNNTSLFFISSVGTALTSEVIIDLGSKIKQELDYSIHEAIHGDGNNTNGYIYFNNLNKEIGSNKIPKPVLDNFSKLDEKFQSIFNDFY